MELCLLAAGATIRLGTIALTLAWTHSIEKTRWEEDWRATPAGLALEEDRIQATGAGMEPPPNARFDGQWWHYKPPLPPMPSVIAAPLRHDGERLVRCALTGAVVRWAITCPRMPTR